MNEEMKLSHIGEIAKTYWEEIPRHFHNVELDEYVIMPNHVHGIIVLFEKVETRHALSLHKQFGKPTKGSISTIVRSFKSAVTKRTHELMDMSNKTIWQPGFYEHIIRSEKDFQNTRDYIINNPLKRLYDEENIDRGK